MTRPIEWWWLSFIDPTGTRQLGVAIVPVPSGGDIPDAADRAWKLGCNPGGHVGGAPMPPAHARFLLGLLSPGILHAPHAAKDALAQLEAQLCPPEDI